MNNKGGLSALYPTVIQTYDAADPTNAAKFGLVASTTDMATINLTDTTVEGACSLRTTNGDNGSYQALRGLYIKMNGNDDSTISGSLSHTGGSSVSPPSYYLVERCIFDRVGFGGNMGFGKASALGTEYYPNACSNWVIRNCGFLNGWRSSVYLSGVSSIVFEDNVIWHNGWKAGVTDRTTSTALGGPQNQRHNLYMQWDTSGTARRNVSIQPSFDSFGIRGDSWVCQHNVSVDSPSHFRLGVGNLGSAFGGEPTEGEYWFPAGFLVNYYRCVAIGGAIEGAASSSYTFGGSIRYTKSGSGFEECLFVKPDVPAEAGEAVIHIDTASDNMIDSNCAFDDNLIVGYTNSTGTNSGGTTTFDGSASYNPVRTFTGVNYIEGSTVDANRVTNAGLSFPTAYTDASLATALGYADVAAMGSAMALSPWTGHAKTLLSAVFTGYGRTLDATVLP